MTSLTTLCATSDLMRRPEEDRAHPRAASHAAKCLRPGSRATRALCAAASIVISLSLLGGVAVGFTAAASLPASASAASA